jgi:two-component system chemotaxis response regulator CheB
VDDSAVVRASIARILDRAPGIEVAGMALDGVLAQRKTLKLQPDVITLDVDMPRMDGFEFLEWLKERRPTPTIVVTGAVTCHSQDLVFDLIEAGATDVVPKPNGRKRDLEEISRSLVEKVRGAARARCWTRRRGPVPPPRFPTPSPTPGPVGQHDLIAIGASTGGPVALSAVLGQLPASAPPVLVVQHMPADFLPRFATRLNGDSPLTVTLARDGDRIEPGHAYVAPGDVHLAIRRWGAGYRIALVQGPKRNHQKPAVDVLFESAADAAGARGCGVLLTGMGRDGADGLLAMRRAGARTLVQDEATSVVYGMAKEAVRLGAAELVLPLERIAGGIFRRGGIVTGAR